MSGDSEEITRLRKPRFSYEENQILIQEVRANYGKLYGTQSRRVTVAERRRVWEGIAGKINGITSWKRTGQEVQKRWNDFKRRTKEKLARVPHSTQGTGNAGDEAFSAEEETLFAILGPGVMPGLGGAESGLLRGTARFGPPRYQPAAEHGTDLPARANVSSSPETSVQPSCLLKPKERDSPAPPPGQPSSLQIVQLAPSPSCLGCGPHPEHSPGELLGTTPCPSISPPLRRRRAHLELPVEPSLDFLQAQRETAAAIRELTYTLRQGLERLTDVVAALLPLLPALPNGLLPPHGEYGLPMATPGTETAPAREGGPAKSELSPRQEQPGTERGSSPNRPPPAQKRKKGTPTRKRRGRWKNL
ncbi:myb-related transcription factor, partner of profilin [Thamnophis elegans]|uniref:myb-related transcription factor, partner of profilin n=1 Tax=Thamnophis elegans TaxID=35005 RepID=UPI0013780085|nr:myb-related transcription factor, partner of profilin [Thamnophis elegans]